MKKRAFSKKICLFLVLALIISCFSGLVTVSAENALGISDSAFAALDLWLEADSGIAMDTDNAVSAWTSKVNAVGKDAPVVLTQNTADSQPVFVEGGTRDKVTFAQDSMSSQKEETPYHGELTVIVVTDPNGTNNTDNIFSVATQRDTRFIRKAKYEMSQWGVKVKNLTYTDEEETAIAGFTSQWGPNGVQGGEPKVDQKAVLTLVSKASSNPNHLKTYENDEYLKTNLFNNTSINDIVASDGGVFAGYDMYMSGTPYNNLTKTNTTMTTNMERPGFDTINRYQIGGSGVDDDYYAILVFKTALSDEDRIAVYNYLNDKYIKAMTTDADAQVDASGEKITIAIDGDIASDALSASDFSVNIGENEAVNPTSAALDDNGNVVLTLTNPVAYGETATVSYTGSAIVVFADKTIDVSAILDPSITEPTFDSVNINVNGSEVVLHTDYDVTADGMSTSDFAVNGDEPTEAKLVNSRYIYLTLASEIAYGTDVTLDYSGNSIKASKPVEAFTGKAVKWLGKDAIPEDDMLFWFETDYGTSTTTDNSAMTTWTDKKYGITLTKGTNNTGVIKYYSGNTPASKPSVYLEGYFPYDIPGGHTGDWSVVIMLKPSTYEYQTTFFSSKGIGMSSDQLSMGSSIRTAGTLGFAINNNNYKGTEFSKDEFNVLGLSVDDGVPSIYKNEEAYYVHNISETGLTTLSNITLGRDATSLGGRIYVAGFVAYKRALSAAEMASVSQYMYEKYNKTADNRYEVSVAASGTDTAVTVAGTIKANAVGIPSSVMPVVAVFNEDGILVDAENQDITNLGLRKTQNISIPVTLSTTSDKITMFLWENFTSIAPLKTSVDIAYTPEA